MFLVPINKRAKIESRSLDAMYERVEQGTVDPVAVLAWISRVGTGVVGRDSRARCTEILVATLDEVLENQSLALELVTAFEPVVDLHDEEFKLVAHDHWFGTETWDTLSRVLGWADVPSGIELDSEDDASSDDPEDTQWIPERDESGSDESGSDESGSDESGSDESGSDESGSDESGSDE